MSEQDKPQEGVRARTRGRMNSLTGTPDDNAYAFETRWFRWRGIRSRESALGEVPKLARRLGFSEAIPWTPYENQLLDLVGQLHLNIDWYEKKIRRETLVYWFYVIGSLGLLLALPVFLYRLNLEESHLAASTAAVVAGLLAFHRGLSSWLSQRRVLARRAKASSTLKELLYAFEQRWDRTFFDSWTADAFERDIAATIEKARAVVREETDTYYAELTYPGFEISSLLSEAGTQAKQLVQSFRPPEQVGKEPVPVDTEAAMRERELQRLRDKVAQFEAELSSTAEIPAADQRKRRLALEEAARQLRGLEIDHA